MIGLPQPQAGLRWRRFRPQHRLGRGPVPVLALVNLALLLILFLVWGSKIVLRPGMIVQLPVAAFVAGAPYGQIVVTVTQEGQLFFNDDRIPLDRLGPALARSVQKNKDVFMTVEADARVSYETVVRIMNLATAAGVRQINLATRPSFGEEVMP
jgi:biopolymer transport protein ExbD